MEVAWHKATIEFAEKYILISWFWAFLEFRALEKGLMLLLVCLVLIISRLESQNKFQILNYIPAAILVYHRCTPTWRFLTGQCKFQGNIYDEYYLVIFYSVHYNFLAFSIGWFSIYYYFFLIAWQRKRSVPFEEQNSNCGIFFCKMIKYVF